MNCRISSPRCAPWCGMPTHEDPTEAPRKVARAFQEMTSGRPSPAALEIPLDQLPAVAEVTPCDPLPRHPAPTPDPEKIARLAGMLDAARNPMIWIGGGALDAGPAIRALAERIGAPVVRFRSARGVLDDRHPLSMTVPAAYKLWPETDLLVAFGTRLDVPAPAGAGAEGLRIARIDIDRRRCAASPSISHRGGCREAAQALAGAVAPREDANAPPPSPRAGGDRAGDQS